MVNESDSALILEILAALVKSSDEGAVESKLGPLSDLVDVPIDSDGVMEDAPAVELELLDDGCEEIDDVGGSPFLEKIDALKKKKKTEEDEEDEE